MIKSPSEMMSEQAGALWLDLPITSCKRDKKNLNTEALKNTLFIPPWLVSCLTDPWSEKQSTQQQSYSMSCMHWDHNPLKALTFLIDALQREILKDFSKSTYTLDLSHLQKNLDSYLLKRINTRKILADLGGLRFFYEDNEQLKARNFFSQEAFKGSALEITIEDFAQELLLGCLSSIDSWLCDKKGNENLRKQFKLGFDPLVLDSSLFLDLKNKHTGFVLELSKSDQWNKELVQLPQNYSLNLNKLTDVDKNFARKPLNLAKELKAINKVVRHMNFHGYSTQLSQKGPFYLEKERRPQVIWQVKNQRLEQLSLSYKEKISTFYATKAFLDPKNDFFSFMSEGLRYEVFSSFKKNFLDLLKNKTRFFTKDFLKDKDGMLLPFIFVFLELCLRSQKNHKYPLSLEIKLLTDIKELNKINLEAEYSSILSKFQEKPYFKELIEKESTFYVSLEANKLEKHKQNPIFTSTAQKNTLSSEVKTAYVPQKFLNGGPLSNNKSHNSHQSKEEDARTIINQRIKEIRAGSQKQYRQIKDLYYNSLNENSRTTLSSLEKRMKKDLFDEQIQEHLVQYIVERNNSIEIKDILKQ